MRTIAEQANKEREKASKLREYAFNLPMEQAIEMRKQQYDAYKKFQFLKKLNQAMCNLDKENTNENKSKQK